MLLLLLRLSSIGLKARGVPWKLHHDGSRPDAARLSADGMRSTAHKLSGARVAQEEAQAAAVLGGRRGVRGAQGGPGADRRQRPPVLARQPERDRRGRAPLRGRAGAANRQRLQAALGRRVPRQLGPPQVMRTNGLKHLLVSVSRQSDQGAAGSMKCGAHVGV